MRRDHWVIIALRIGPIARPGIIGRLRNQTGANRVGFDIVTDGEQRGLGINQRGAITPFPEGSGTLIAGIEILHIIAAHRLHQPADAVLQMRREQEMEVVRHQHVSMNLALKLFSGKAELFPDEPVILLLEQDLLSIVATLNDMLGIAGQDEAGKARHGVGSGRLMDAAKYRHFGSWQTDD